MFLFGRDRHIADIPTDHPSCSGQHAVIQVRRCYSIMSRISTIGIHHLHLQIQIQIQIHLHHYVLCISSFG